jgi:glycosyltransferase involved in cell wall biosynthesis
MDLIINGTGATRTSLGARRYFEGVMRHLNWPGNVVVSPLARWSKLERANELLDRGRSDALYWSPSHRGPLFAHNHVVTVLDCINVEYTYRGDWRLPLYRRMFSLMLGNATAVVAISQATANALERNYAFDPAKLVVIPGPVNIFDQDMVPSPAVATAAAAERAEDGPFVLMITNTLPHKNTSRAAAAFARSDARRRGVALRVVGSLDPADLSTCIAAGVNLQIRKGVDEATLSRWLAGCRFLLAPSLDEGLNLPVAEALAHGSNVLCSDIEVHREFYGGRVRFFDPLNEDDMVASLDDALAQEGHWPRTGPSLPQLSFPDVAGQYRALFLRLADGSAPQAERLTDTL